jgi:hypothetical protein
MRGGRSSSGGGSARFETCREGLPQRLCTKHARPIPRAAIRTRGSAGALWGEHESDAELAALLEPSFGLRSLTETAGEPDLPERRRTLAHRDAASG